jgi:hypothetical protein
MRAQQRVGNVRGRWFLFGLFFSFFSFFFLLLLITLFCEAFKRPDSGIGRLIVEEDHGQGRKRYS